MPTDSERKTSSQYGQRWTREEVLAAFNFYCREDFGQLHRLNPEIIQLAERLGRTPDSVAMRLVNLASQDPAIQQSGRRGLGNASALDKRVWQEFESDRDHLIFESEQAMARLEVREVDSRIHAEIEKISPPKGLDREGIRRFRVNHTFFHDAVFSAYRGRCCVTGLAVKKLLTASHIIPWSINKQERLNPRNGLCLNALHDRAFDRGLMTVQPDGTVRLSPQLLTTKQPSDSVAFLSETEGQKIEVPAKFPPAQEFLQYHNDNVFQST